jgi:hypothetical protein
LTNRTNVEQGITKIMKAGNVRFRPVAAVASDSFRVG